MNLKRTFHIIRRTLQIASKIKQYDAVDTKRITFQRVKVDDYYKVLSIRSPGDVYEGYDYLPDRFHKLISSSSIEGYAASIDNKLVSPVNVLKKETYELKQRFHCGFDVHEMVALCLIHLFLFRNAIKRLFNSTSSHYTATNCIKW